jgi:hypothetical protein
MPVGRYLIAAGTSKYPQPWPKLSAVPREIALVVECFKSLGYEWALEDLSLNLVIPHSLLRGYRLKGRV